MEGRGVDCSTDTELKVFCWWAVKWGHETGYNRCLFVGCTMVLAHTMMSAGLMC